MRPQTACTACRNRRRKCEAETIGVPCHYCADRGIPCSLAAGSPSDQSITTSIQLSPSPLTDTFSDTSALDLPPSDVCMELVELYFRYVHDQFHSLFHRPSFLAETATGAVPLVLLFAIMSLSARFSNHEFFMGTFPRTRGKTYAEAANRLLDLRDVSLTTIQACVLLGAFHVTEGQPGLEGVYYSTACRMAQVLDLANARMPTRLQQEINIRVWSSLWMIDVWSSSGLRIPKSMPQRRESLLPMDELDFFSLQQGDHTIPLHPEPISNSESSLLAQMVKLNEIYEMVNEANHLAVENSQDDMTSIPLFQTAALRLDQWLQEIPDRMRDTQLNLVQYGSENIGHIFVAVYLGYYHYGQLLYYRFLQDFNSPHARLYAEKCKAHATGLCEILHRAYATPGCAVYYTMVAHVLVIASTVQLHILLFDPDPKETRAARHRLAKNFEILTNLQVYWPSTDVCFARFREFHRACLKPTEASFRMDRWMLRFLSDFARPVGVQEREDMNTAQEWSLQEFGISPS